MSLYRLSFQRCDGSWKDEGVIYGNTVFARQRAKYLAQLFETPVQIIDDWDDSVVETVDALGETGEGVGHE